MGLVVRMPWLPSATWARRGRLIPSGRRGGATHVQSPARRETAWEAQASRAATAQDHGNVRERRRREARRQDGSLISTRSLLILTLAVMIGVLAGLAAGIAAVKYAATPWAIAIGLITGLGAAMLTGLTAAGALHLLVGKNHG